MFMLTWLGLEIIIPSKIKAERKAARKAVISYDITYMWTLNTWYK